MANGSMVQIAGSVKFLLKCGAYRGVVKAWVFPRLDNTMILGIPWLRKENPQVDWTRSTVVVQQKNQWISLPLVQKTNPSAYSVNEISANEAQTMFHQGEMQEAFLGFVRCVNEESVVMEVQRESIQNSSPKWREDLPDSIRAVLEEYDDIFPQDLPRGLPLVRKGHEFEIKLEDDIPSIYRPLYKVSPRKLQEGKDQIQSMLKHGFIRPSDSLRLPSFIHP